MGRGRVKNHITRLAAVLIISVMLVCILGITGPSKTSAADSDPDAMSDIDFLNRDSYEEYLDKYPNAVRPDLEIIIAADKYTDTDIPNIEVLENFEGAAGKSLKTLEEGYVEWEVDVPQAGFYNIEIEYYPIEGRSAAIERELMINGEIPFTRARYILFSRVWADAQEIKRDNRDNDLRPSQIEKPLWMSSYISDYMGYYNEPYMFYFEKGKNSIRLTAVKEPMVIRSIRLGQAPVVKEYRQKLEEYQEKGYKTADDYYKEIEGEHAAFKSDPMLYPIYDRTSPSTQPYHKSKIRLNTIGGYRWVLPGQWISWVIDVEEAGLYQIAIKCRQNIVRGLYTNRRMTINGEVPFKEVENISINYDNGWQMKQLGDEEPYLFYLKEGKNEIKLEVVLGDLSEILRVAEDSVIELNNAYRKILMITGSSPDPYRDYQIERALPGVIDTLNNQSEVMKELSVKLQEYTGQRGSHNAILDRLAHQLESLADRPDTISKRLDAFRANVGALSQWILTTREQPLEIDFLVISSPDKKLPKPEVGFFAKVMHEIRSFTASFYEDYDSIGNVHDEALKVWIGTGRDQAQVLKDMIDDTFTPETGINVNLELVQPDVLLPATVARRAPDVVMQVAVNEPVNLAVRNAVADLSDFPGFDQVIKRFHDSAIVPYRFEGGLYALPEQQMFPMLFYRKDILGELDLTVPDTWQDIFNMLPTIQKNHMDFAIPVSEQGVGGGGMQSYSIMLFQLGGSLYHDEGIASGLDSEEAIEAFKRWTTLYVNYKLPLQLNIVNRFRTGEVPIAINDYSLYNTLSVFAPELRGLWEFAPIPGLPKEDGTIDRSSPSSGTGVIMMEQSENKDAAWEFMKWWTSSESQVRFAREMESLMGPAARYPTANIDALEQMPWPIKDYHALKKQWEWVQGIPEVPGGYFTPRHLDNAFRSVVLNGEDARETLLDYVRIINEEIDIKRQEFGLRIRE